MNLLYSDMGVVKFFAIEIYFVDIPKNILNFAQGWSHYVLS